MRIRPLLMVLAALAAPCSVSAQRVAGVVMDSLGRPLSDVRITTARPSQPTEHAALTDSAGHFSVAIPAAGPFGLTASRIGFVRATMFFEQRDAALAAPLILRLARIPVSPALLSAVETRARRSPVERRRDTPGETRGAEFAFMLDGRAIDAGNLNEIALSAPGALAVGSGDEAGVSVAGQASDRNHTSVDGSSFAGTSLPPEAVASAGVVLNAYDASRGQYSGGELTATTRSGTNIWAGALRSSGSPASLRYGTLSPPGTGDRVSTTRIGGGGGGALIADRLFIFGSFDASRRSGKSSFLDLRDSSGLSRLGLSPDSAAAFLVAARHAGFSDRSTDVTSSGSDNGSLLARVDLALGERHLATMRLDAATTRLPGVGGTPYSAAGTAGAYRAGNGGMLLSLSSRDDRFNNELRMYASDAERRVTSGFPGAGATALSRGGEIDGSGALTTFRAGGAPLGVSAGSRHFLEFADELSQGRERDHHQWRTGVLFNREVSRTAPADASGSYAFASIADFTALRASGFTRGRLHEAEAAVGFLAIHAGDTWHAFAPLMLTYGVRLEYSWDEAVAAGSTPSAPIDSALSGSGLVQDMGKAPRPEWRVLPRMGFSYRPARTPFSLLGGAGMFRARPSASARSPFINERGTDGTLSCVGMAVRQPTALSGLVTPDAPCDEAYPAFVSATAPVTLFTRSFSAPLTYRASLDATWRFGRRAIVHLRPTVLRVGHEALAGDLTLVRSPVFTLPLEAGRPVYVPLASIDANSGRSSVGASHRTPGLGAVRGIRSDGRSATDQVSLGVEGTVPAGGALSLWYTYTNSRDMATGVGAPGGSRPTTGGDPSSVDWAAKDFEQRHAVIAEARYGITRHASVVATARLASGVPYTPLVSGDVNGDGSSNDRAFVPDTRSVEDPALAAAFDRLLSTAPSPTATCLREQAGHVAARNSCRTGWTAFFDIKLATRPFALLTTRQMAFTLSMQNVAAAADYLAHGADALRGWGQSPQPDNILLRVRGFDPASRSFRYELNPDFGTYGTSRSYHQPFLITVEARVTLGADPARQAFTALIAAARSAPRTADELAPFLATRFPNVAAVVLVNRDSLALQLDATQLEQLGRLARVAESSLGASRRTVADLLASTESSRRATLPTAARTAEALVDDVRMKVQALLTNPQWQSLPLSLRIPTAGNAVEPPIPLSLPNP